MIRGARVGPALVMMAVMASCGADDSDSAAGPRAIDRDGNFVLEFTVAEPRYVENEPIVAAARLQYRGAANVAHLWGSGTGPIFFKIEQLDGDIDTSPGGHDDCVPYDVFNGRPLEAAFRKNHGWSADDPMAAFWEDFSADPQLRLPAGRYRLSALVSLLIGTGCDGDLLDMRSSIEIEVTAR
jgi:hypothetical protein